MQFSKMHGLGNDFMIIDNITQNVSLLPKTIRWLSNRHYGIGFDQLLLIERSNNDQFDFHYRIFNANGNETTQCGNGARCLAIFVRMKNLIYKNDIYVSTKNRQLILHIQNHNTVLVNMGEPNFEPQKIPFITNQINKIYSTYIAEQKISYGVVSIGNPHCVLVVDQVHSAPVNKLGSLLEKHKCFPEGANISFMQVLTRHRINLRVYERDVGETMACGSAACAAVAVGISQDYLNNQVLVNLPGGCINITWQGVGYPLYMCGPANHIYDGSILL